MAWGNPTLMGGVHVEEVWPVLRKLAVTDFALSPLASDSPSTLGLVDLV